MQSLKNRLINITASIGMIVPLKNSIIKFISAKKEWSKLHNNLKIKKYNLIEKEKKLKIYHFFYLVLNQNLKLLWLSNARSLKIKHLYPILFMEQNKISKYMNWSSDFIKDLMRRWSC